MNKPNFKKLFEDFRATAHKHSPEILTGLGIAGMVTTSILAVRATPKALRLIEEEKKEKWVDELTPMETVKVAWKCYIPAAITGIASTACLIGASKVSLKRNAALATAYKLSETALSEYKEKVVETIGEKKEQAIREAIDKDRVEKNPVSKNEVIITSKGDTLCLDPLSKRYFKSSRDRIVKAENTLNKRMLHDMFGYASLNDFYIELGLDTIDIGDDLGWNVNELISIEFGSQIADNDEPCLVLNYQVAPRYNYTTIM